MKTNLLAAGLTFLCGIASPAAVTLVIDNQSGVNDGYIWIEWTGQATPAPLSGNLKSGAAIAPSPTMANPTGYQLTSFANVSSHVYAIKNFTMNGGRMWFTYGTSGFSFPNGNAAYTPPLNSFNDVNFLKRYDKIEAFIQGSTDDNVDTTAVDGFSIPFKITATGRATNGLPAPAPQFLTSANGSTVLAALLPTLANSKAPAPVSPAGQPAGVYPFITRASPYLNIDSNSLGLTSTNPNYKYSPVTSEGSFVRVIGNDQDMTNVFYQNSPAIDPCAQANGNAIPANYLYPPFTAYLSYLDGTATTHYTGLTTIAGTYGGLSPTETSDSLCAQTYNLTATLNPQATMTLNSVTYTGVVTLAGTTKLTAGPDTGKTMELTIKTPYAQLLAPSGIVGANPAYQYTYALKGTANPPSADVPVPQNDLFTDVNADFLAGLNLGTVGSTVSFTGTLNGTPYTNVQIGAIPSGNWFYLGQYLASKSTSNPKPLPWAYYFKYVQPTNPFYNTYAAALTGITSAYSWSYGDRVQGGEVAISWNAIPQAGQGLPAPMDEVIITILPDNAPAR